MKYWDLLSKEQKQNIVEFLDNIGAEDDYLENYLNEVEVLGYTILYSEDLYIIVKDNRIVDIALIEDYDMDRLEINVNYKYKLISFTLFGSYDTEVLYSMFDTNDETWLQFE